MTKRSLSPAYVLCHFIRTCRFFPLFIPVATAIYHMITTSYTADFSNFLWRLPLCHSGGINTITPAAAYCSRSCLLYYYSSWCSVLYYYVAATIQKFIYIYITTNSQSQQASAFTIARTATYGLIVSLSPVNNNWTTHWFVVRISRNREYMWVWWR